MGHLLKVNAPSQSLNETKQKNRCSINKGESRRFYRTGGAAGWRRVGGRYARRYRDKGDVGVTRRGRVCVQEERLRTSDHGAVA